MRRSRLVAPQRKEDPLGAFLTSHKLLLRSGLFRSAGPSGFFQTLPVGHRVLDKLERIVEARMNAIGAQRTRMPLLMSSEAWKATGRWDTTGDQMFRLKDRKDLDMLLCPTHEEAFAECLGGTYGNVSKSLLPLLMYQIGPKFRDEIRPRFGLLRGREFVMKDMYTFHETQACAEQTYAAVCAAYLELLPRLIPGSAPVEDVVARVEADSGTMGGTYSHEFHFCNPVGEDTLLKCDRGDYAANVERAAYVADPAAPTAVEAYRKRRFRLPSGRNLSKVRADNYLDAAKLTVVEDDAEIDAAALGLVEARHGDPCACPTCACRGEGALRASKGIEVGHAFVLGTKYTAALGAKVDGQPLIMSCYGLGVTRILQALIELPQGHDEHGIVFHPSIAPFAVAVVSTPTAPSDRESEVFEAFTRAFGNDALVDDRTSMGLGAKIAEARLMGCPLIAIVGSKGNLELLTSRASPKADPSALLKFDSVSELVNEVKLRASASAEAV